MSTNPRKKICQMVVLPHLTGVQRSTMDICKRIDPERFEVHLICQGEGDLSRELEKIGARCHFVPELDRPIRLQQDWRALRRIRQICKEQQFDIVHTHSSKTGVLGRISARRAGVGAVVHHVRGFAFHEYSSKLSRFIYSRVEKFAARYCDKVIFVNDEERRMAIENKWIPAEKCITIYNGADLDLYDSKNNAQARVDFRKEHGLDDEEVAIVIGGRFMEQKQSMIVPDIAAALDQQLPDARWRILMAGEGELEEPLRQKIVAREMGHRVELIGWHPNPNELMAGCDVMLLPSLWEGLPRVLIEAQASGLSIVASDIKGNREVVTEQTGFLCEPKNPDSYVKGLSVLISEKETRTRMGAAARKRAEETFDIRNTFEKILTLYDDLLNRPKAGE
ncbi:MAG: glycosyltransferase involved in cell wall biosynthesis [Verrucomicrobiales bacterium]|jgi:glycosyltransferase involved in cell wall biosynthesis